MDARVTPVPRAEMKVGLHIKCLLLSLNFNRNWIHTSPQRLAVLNFMKIRSAFL
jgi:hypothetical protein